MAEGYIENSLENKIKTSNKILKVQNLTGQINNPVASTSSVSENLLPTYTITHDATIDNQNLMPNICISKYNKMPQHNL